MSEEKKTKLAETLAHLDREERAWAINFLVQLLTVQEEGKTKRVRHKSCVGLTDLQWEEYFKDQPDVSDGLGDTVLTDSFLHATAGKTIKPIEKWL